MLIKDKKTLAKHKWNRLYSIVPSHLFLNDCSFLLIKILVVKPLDHHFSRTLLLNNYIKRTIFFFLIILQNVCRNSTACWSILVFIINTSLISSPYRLFFTWCKSKQINQLLTSHFSEWFWLPSNIYILCNMNTCI